jgi:peptidoglycan/xylan/chitin deacetylase (PgdA/CDA1 family)
VRAHPDLARRVAAEGHTIGNHTHSHPNLTRVSPAVVRSQMTVGAGAIQDVTGVKTRFFRAPGGSVNGVVQAEAAALGERIVRWTVDPNDWRKPSTGAVIGRVVSATQPGAVVLLHDGGGDRNQTIEALPEIIRVLREQGFRFLTLDELYPAE